MTTSRADEAPPSRGSTARRRLLATVAAALALVLALLIGVQIGRSTVDMEPGASGTDPDSAESRESGGTRLEVPAELTWAPPELDDPETIEVTEDEHGLKLEDDSDYVIEMPDEPLDVVGGLTIHGGRNVVLIGGEIRISEEGEGSHAQRALFLKDQTGTVHIEGLHITGAALAEGVNLDQRKGATIQLQNIRVEQVVGERDGHHADVIQTWAGPSVLRVDRLTGYTTYQGFFLLAKQFIDDDPEGFDLRNVNLIGEDAGYLLWRDSDAWPIEVQNVWVETDKDPDDRDQFLWARGDNSDDTWDDVKVGTPPRGDFVPAEVVGVDYASPGYAGDGADD
ncbi:hypothetical protein [Cellulomonas sp. ATA003]|uniref:hypothetical protein n=1 Tax=Cellulomonas sp. ATA003 TaxID=3073064 RepID=UPI0028731408|nr:hypothetical protein [Cellulomonas sp. ATA003]WNB85432.1 hypothetical protein REH70_17910 [Cellulomonas sp. ATA003]